MSTFFTILVIILVFLIIFQIAKASEYVSVLKGEERARKDQNKVNGFFMLIFLVAGLIGVFWCNEALKDIGAFAYPAASVQGEKIDDMMWVTLVITGIVFFVTQIALFWFAYRYQETEKRKAYYFPHNNMMEIIWTVIPTLALTILVVIGLRNWFSFTGEAPKNANVVEITGKQFGWIFRYPGYDGVFGNKYYKMIDPASNVLGLNWYDVPALHVKDDPATHDDIVIEQTMYAVKNKPLKLIINSRDVIHDVGLPWFRLKMDAVPGTPTTLWFTPKYTTKEMKEITNNPNFVYEIACDQLCGNGHYSMKGVIEVVTQPEYDEWLTKQKPAYYTAFPDKDPSAITASQKPAVADKALNGNKVTTEIAKK